jgi:hypothetical protein
MADESTTATAEEQTAPEGNDDPAAIAASAEKPDAVEKALRSERARAREAAKKAEAAEARLREIEDRDKSEKEKAETRAVEAEKKAQDAELRAVRMEVATDKKLPASLARRLQGTTKEELEADADELLKDFEAPAATAAASAVGREAPRPCQRAWTT